jgi:hypothetical protein
MARIQEQVKDDGSQGSDRSTVASDLISFLAFGNKHDTEEHFSTTTASTSSTKKKAQQQDPNHVNNRTNHGDLQPATIVYHESARSIVFRDQVRRSQNPDTVKRYSSTSSSSSSMNSSLHSIRNDTLAKCTPIQEEEDEKEKQRAKIGKDYDDKASKASLSAYLGTTDHSVHNKSVGSIGSTLDLDQQHSVHSLDTSNVTPEIDNSQKSFDTPKIIIANFTPKIEPLPPLDLEPHNEFEPLLQSNPYEWNTHQNSGPEHATIIQNVWKNMTNAEKEVVELLQTQKCLVKTVKNSDWTSFLQKFEVKQGMKAGRWLHPAELGSASQEERRTHFREGHDETLHFHSFVTSCTLLPACGMKMRCYGSTKEYTCGIIFSLPKGLNGNMEDAAVKENNVWCWPSGYSAKTEFNISEYGELLNGRKEALVTLNELRDMNHQYLYEKDYKIAGRLVKGGLNTLPYNEVYVRVGGKGRIVNQIDVATGKPCTDSSTNLDGLGLPVALFVRTAMYGDLTALLRLRARFMSVIGPEHIKDIPLLLISPDIGVRVLTETLEHTLLKTLANSLNPFQNPHLSRHTEIDHVRDSHFQQKLEELLDLDHDNIRNVLTVEECARLAGGFGATDDSVANLLMDVMVQDFEKEENPQTPQLFNGDQSTKLQSIVNEGLAAAVRANDFNTSRQLLILYSLVASRGKQEREREIQSKTRRNSMDNKDLESISDHRPTRKLLTQVSHLSMSGITPSETAIKVASLPPPPPPPPLDTDRLRSATNSDGLLAVLGAAEVLKSIQTGEARKRALEAAQSIEEWVHKSENSVAYRLASWRNLQAAQDDLKIATETNSNFMAFISNKAINNRKRFASELREAVEATTFEGIEFLKSIHFILKEMHHPCLRLELLQFILGLDNRYSIAHVARSIELAATCLSISATDEIFADDEE